MYDIIFISYQEPNSDNNYSILKNRFPIAKRIHGVKGIHQAHIAAAKLSLTKMFWVVDGDAIIENDFNFDYTVSKYNLDTVHVWQSRNPINDLVYGYGGVKLLPKNLTINMNVNKLDMTTSISKNFKLIENISNITNFNTDPFNTWKSAFRECAKLASKSIDRQNDVETEDRLQTWTTISKDEKFGKYAICGAKQGMKFGSSKNLDLSLINDFEWLKEQFKKNIQ